ncbi:LPXTG cell wall anchor domain-containing protein [Clostridium sp.]|uniref:LPXTG cell wall anchor domain-containing protein n=1 Tax=Clostridium sp. TaxID=1506 RepID=UPI001A5C561E|nr:LPXTG cell wall anchor domain-containing protein [Clostridium sp.]MBK5240121.1 LPXTG cell wall anchor domain-containing protein [Clostridium sp.]
MRKTMKMKIYTMALVLIFVMGQILTGASTMVKAVENDFEVSVQVEGFEKIITTGTSSKSNGFEALKEVLDKNNISMTSNDEDWGKFISEIGGINSAKFGGYDGWLYAIRRNNSYEDIASAIDGATLENGDKLILYYGDMGTMTANKIDYSTKDANVELTISLNNTYEDYTTKKEVIQPITGIMAKIDDKDVVVVDNKITLAAGLEVGTHTLELSDFRTEASPKVVYDKIEFTIGKEVAPVVEESENITAEVVDNTTITKEISQAINSSVAAVNAKGIDTWSAVSLNTLGEKVDTTFLKESIEDIKVNGVKDLINTDIEKLIIGLTAAGYTPYNVEGYDLVSELFNRDINTFLINDAVFGIFAYNYANIEEDYKVSKEKLADIIMKSKLSYDADKMVGWTYYGDKIDPDMTGAAINALSEFSSTKPDVKAAIDAAVNSLSILQNESGYSISQYGLASETTAFVILGLTSVGIDPEGETFIKAKGDLVSALLSFKAEDGGFKHLVEDTKSNYTSTEQVLRALIAIKEYKTSGKYDFYSSDINAKELPVFVLGDSTTTDKIETTNEAEANTLPQTGSTIDTNVLIVLGMLFMVIGVLYTRKISSEK